MIQKHSAVEQVQLDFLTPLLSLTALNILWSYSLDLAIIKNIRHPKPKVKGNFMFPKNNLAFLNAFRLKQIYLDRWLIYGNN